MSAEESVARDSAALPAPTDTANLNRSVDAQPDASDSLPSRAASAATEEVDLWWGSYAPRTMAPSFVLCLVLTLAISAEAWSLGIWQERSPARYTAQALMGLLWLIQFMRWAYRIFATNYRLTNRRLFREQGFHRPENREAELSRISQVVVERGPFERLLRVGRLRVLIPGHDVPPIVLEGVVDPEHVAMAIRMQVHRARAQLH